MGPFWSLSFLARRTASTFRSLATRCVVQRTAATTPPFPTTTTTRLPVVETRTLGRWKSTPTRPLLPVPMSKVTALLRWLPRAPPRLPLGGGFFFFFWRWAVLRRRGGGAEPKEGGGA